MVKEKSYRLSPKALLKKIREFNKDPEFREAVKAAYKYHTGQA